MTKAQYRARYNKVLRDTVKLLKEYREAALKAGVVIPEQDTGMPFQLPLNVLCAGLMEMQDRWAPTSKESKQAVKTIYTQTFLSCPTSLVSPPVESRKTDEPFYTHYAKNRRSNRRR
jgi:hypothetical protein